MDWSSITPAVVIALCSLVTAWCSFFVALSNYRRSNYPVIRVVQTEAPFTRSIDRGDYHQFRIVIQNLGIPLQNLSMTLQYSPEDGFGWGSFPLKSADAKPIREGQFPKGAITEFAFATDRLDDNYDGFLRDLTDLKAQRALLVLHADRYQVWSLRLHDRTWRAKRRWNRLAGWLNWYLMRVVKTARGTNGLKPILRLPAFESPGQDLLALAANVRKSPPREMKPGWRPTAHRGAV